MKTETLVEMFKACDGEYLKFNRINQIERLHPSRRLCGMLKLASLMQQPAEFDDLCAEHDIIFLCHADDLRDDVTADDVKYLYRCGIQWDNSNDSLIMHT